MKIKLKWHKFLCGVFGHKWKEVEEGDEKFEFVKAWFICLRCAKAITLNCAKATRLTEEINDKNKHM